MLFNSLEFLLVFLPITTALFALARYYIGPRAAAVVVCLASTYFYAHWSFKNAPILLVSVTFDYLMAMLIIRERQKENGHSKELLTLAITLDLSVLAFFKYSRFFVETVNDVFHSSFPLPDVPLPLGISFYTFQQIAFLVACQQMTFPFPPYRNYFFFVTYFPHLIAGPLILHKVIIPQLTRPRFGKLLSTDVQAGIALLVLGLSKKVLIADNLSEYVGLYFTTAAHGPTTMPEAWLGVIAYAFQLYFDFSGYSDMAIGLGKLFSLDIPVNFYSPYKATSIIDFWRRWHITLSGFLRDHVYIPLGGSRYGFHRQMGTLLFTMTLCGLWHGASWNFVVWGIYHGVLLLLIHIYRRLIVPLIPSFSMPRLAGRALTFMLVCVGWAFFRSPNMTGALQVIRDMFNPASIVIPEGYIAYFHQSHVLSSLQAQLGLSFGHVQSYLGVMQLAWVAGAGVLVWAGTSLVDVFNIPLDQKGVDRAKRSPLLVWQQSKSWAIAIGVLMFLCLASIGRPSEFLYFNF